MTDNVIASAAIGVGSTFATKDIAGTQYPRNIITDPSGVDITPAKDATLTAGAQQTKLTDGTNAVGVTAAGVVGNELTVDRLKVNASLRMLDTSLTAGSQLVAARGDQTTGLWVNVKNAVAVTQSGTWTVGALDATASGSITAVSQAVAIALNGKSGVAIQITGAWVGTLQFEGTVDGTNWVTVNGVVAGASTPGATTTSNGIVRLTPSGLAQVRVTSTAWTSGTAVISMRASDAAGGTFLNQSLTAGANVIGKVGIDQTTPGTTNAVQITNASIPVTGAFFQATQPISGTVTLTSTTITGTVAATQSGTWNIGSIATLPALVASAANIGKITATQFDSSADTTMQTAAVAVGNGTVLATTGYGTASIQITGTFVGTITFEGTEDGTNYVAVAATQLGASSIASTATIPGIYRLAVAGLTNIRARISAYTSGSITAVGRTTNAPFGSKFVQLVPSTNVIGALAANQSVNTAQIAGVAPAMNTGVRAPGVQRVTIATDDLVPVTANDLTASGNITTQNLVPGGVATAGSAVEIALNGQGTLGIQTVGTYTGALSVQGQLDGTNWVTINPQLLRGSSNATQGGIASTTQDIFTTTVSGYAKVRITALAAVTGSVAVSLRVNQGNASAIVLGAGGASIGSLGANSNVIGDIGVQYRASSTGAASVAKILATASTNATSVKASAGRLLGWTLQNTTAAVKVVHIHDLAVAPTVGTSVPKFSIVLPANGSKETMMEGGMSHAAGISYSITGAVADLDTTVTAANDVIGALYFA